MTCPSIAKVTMGNFPNHTEGMAIGTEVMRAKYRGWPAGQTVNGGRTAYHRPQRNSRIELFDRGLKEDRPNC
ncbi:MAG: hypothetical protein WBE97_04120 [Candidatus Acidiferrales bacterium]